jgi:hypothetical protein
MNKTDYINKYFKQEWVLVNPENSFEVLKTEFIHHFFSSFDECVEEAKIASQHLSGGHYYAFQAETGIFTWIRADVLGMVSGREMEAAYNLAKRLQTGN